MTTLDWEPDIQGKDLVVAEFVPGPSKKLKVSGLITKKVDSTEPPTFEFTGTLDDFRVGVLKSVFVNFVRFEFTRRAAEAGRHRPARPAQPIEFAGDLEFVEELRKAIPPDLFGDGPSLDITPTGVRAGFAIGLPPVAVGVFALKDVSLGAGLTLPFTTASRRSTSTSPRASTRSCSPSRSSAAAGSSTSSSTPRG